MEKLFGRIVTPLPQPPVRVGNCQVLWFNGLLQPVEKKNVKIKSPWLLHFGEIVVHERWRTKRRKMRPEESRRSQREDV
jgi:hypothetical protein